MLSAKAIYHEIRANDETYRLFLSTAAKGEAQGGWENERIANLTRDAELAAKIAAHGQDEEKHGRLFVALLKKRGLDPIAVPESADYCMLLERAGIGLSHTRLRSSDPLSDEEILAYLAHSRVTEQRASEEVAQQMRSFADDPELGKAVRMIAADEVRHLAYCHRELLAFADRGHAGTIREMLEHYARVEIRVYRDVSLVVMGEMARELAWPRWKQLLIGFGIRISYWAEKLWRWRRLTRLDRQYS